jgi:hypothetical protein
MPIMRKSVKVLRFWYRMSLRPEVKALSHSGRWWLYGVVMQWSGANNGIIEFAKSRHGAALGLGHTITFRRAQEEVLATRLIEISRQGGRNKPTLYLIPSLPIQASPNGKFLGSPHDPMDAMSLGSPDDPMTPDSWVTTSPKLGRPMTQGNTATLKNARASENRKRFSDPAATSLTKSQHGDPANDEAGQGQDAGSPRQPNGTPLEAS